MAEQDFFLTRDASGRRAARNRAKVHASKRDSWTGQAVTACSGLLVAEQDPADPAEVPEARRCRAGGCRQQWEQWLRANVT